MTEHPFDNSENLPEVKSMFDTDIEDEVMNSTTADENHDEASEDAENWKERLTDTPSVPEALKFSVTRRNINTRCAKRHPF